MEFSTVLKKNFGVDFWLLFLVGIKLPGLLCDRSPAEVLQKGVQQGRFGSLYFFWLLDPFLELQRLKSIKKGSSSLYFGFP
jgi:hypothetical protein